MIDPRPLWDFDDAAASEERFRALAAGADEPDRSVLLTQVARARGLQEAYDDGHAVLDAITIDHPEVRVRTTLERGRLLRSGGRAAESRPVFEAAFDAATEAGLDTLRVDALHMVALVADPAEQLALHEQALEIARGSHEQGARDWEASLLNNLGMTHADAGDFEAALPVFEQALAERTRLGVPGDIRVARWMIAWSLRNLGRTDEALVIQRELQTELAAAGETDPYVEEELALLTAADRRSR